MTTTTPLTLRVRDLPLWRLLVALDDTERTIGADSETARVLAGAIQARLHHEPDSASGAAAGQQEAPHV
jgi:hypothetical protein